ncbi:MAG: hypothetical protein ACRD4F_18810 [Candidatus Angelobacter sp.]
MKNFAFLVASVMLLFVLGCSGNDKDKVPEPAGSMPLKPNVAAGANGARGNVAPVQSPQPDAYASGGSTLPASTPYSQANAPAATQSLNAAPFLGSSEVRGELSKTPPSPGLTSRADGTMYGPQDQPAAGIGPGTMGETQGNGFPSKSIQGAGRKSGAGGAIPSGQSGQGSTPK